MYTMADTTQERVYKTPVYIRNAKKNYHDRKVKVDPEYAEKIRSISREWHKKKRAEDEDFKENYSDRNLEASRKRSKDNMKTFVNGSGLAELIEQIPTCFRSEKIQSANMDILVRNTLFAEVNGVPLYMRLKATQPKRRIRSVCVSVIYYVASLVDSTVPASEAVKCYNVANATLKGITDDIKSEMK